MPAAASLPVQPLPSPTVFVGVAPPLTLPKDAAVVRQVIVSLLQEEGIFYDDNGPDIDQLSALTKTLTQRLTDNTDDVRMVRVQQLMARVCEYADIVVQACFRSGGASDATDAKENGGDLPGVAPPPPCECAISINGSSPPSPVKSEEIRPSSEQDLVTDIKPFDKQFQDLQDGLRELAAQSESLRARLEALDAEQEKARDKLYKQESCVNHRLQRARVRHILFVAKLEEEWLKDPDSVAANKSPCAECAKSRKARPKLKHPAPVPGTAVKVGPSK